MKMKPAIVLSLLAACLIQATAWAAVPPVADKITTDDGKTLLLNGWGVRTATIFGVKVYLAALYSEKTSQSADELITSNQRRELRMKFLRDVGADKIRGAWSEGMKKNCTTACEGLTERLQKLNSWMPEMKENQTMDFRFGAESVQVFVNGQKSGEIQGKDFARALLAVWLGKYPPTEDLRKGLLGQAN